MERPPPPAYDSILRVGRLALADGPAARSLPGAASIPTESYFDRFYRWLELESAAEAQQLAERRRLQTRKMAEQSGETLLDLAIEDHQTGLGGRHLFTFVKRNRTLDSALESAARRLAGRDFAARRRRRVAARRRRQPRELNSRSRWRSTIGSSASVFDIDLSTDEVSRNRERAALQAVSLAARPPGRAAADRLGRPRFAL